MAVENDGGMNTQEIQASSMPPKQPFLPNFINSNQTGDMMMNTNSNSLAVNNADVFSMQSYPLQNPSQGQMYPDV